jgi:hypothetical protein
MKLSLLPEFTNGVMLDLLIIFSCCIGVTFSHGAHQEETDSKITIFFDTTISLEGSPQSFYHSGSRILLGLNYSSERCAERNNNLSHITNINQDIFGIYQYVPSADLYTSIVDGSTISVDNIHAKKLISLSEYQCSLFNFTFDDNEHNTIYQIGEVQKPFPNNIPDLKEMYYALSLKWSSLYPGENLALREILRLTKKNLDILYEGNVEVALTKPNREFPNNPTTITQEISNNGLRKILLAHNHIDSSHFINHFITKNQIEAALCSKNITNVAIHQVHQYGRTPEFNAALSSVLLQSLQKIPMNADVAIVYTTAGLPWPGTSPSYLNTAHPWAQETYHENAYLNMQSFKHYATDRFGSQWNLHFTRLWKEKSLLRSDSYFGYFYGTSEEYGGEFRTTRQSIDAAKEDGRDYIIVLLSGWLYSSAETLIRGRKVNEIPLLTTEKISAKEFSSSWCESGSSTHHVTDSSCPHHLFITESFDSNIEEIAMSVTQQWRSGIEKFGVFPEDKEEVVLMANSSFTKIKGGYLNVTLKEHSVWIGAAVEIPPDPYPEYPQEFSQKFRVAFDNPVVTFESSWEDSVLFLGRLEGVNPPMLIGLNRDWRVISPPVYVGPYKMTFNRPVEISIPLFNPELNATLSDIRVFVYNHVTKSWEVHYSPSGSPHISSLDEQHEICTFQSYVFGLYCLAKMDNETSAITH